MTTLIVCLLLYGARLWRHPVHVPGAYVYKVQSEKGTRFNASIGCSSKLLEVKLYLKGCSLTLQTVTRHYEHL